MVTIDISDIQLSRIIGVIVTHFAQKNHIAEKQLAVQNTRQMKTESIAEFLNGFKQRLKAIEIEINYRNRNGVIVSPMPEYQVVDALLVNLQDLIYNYVMKRKFELYQNLAITLEQTEGILHECQRFTQGLDGQGSRKRRHKPRATHTSINALHQVYDDEEICCANKRQFIDANLRQNTQFDDAKWREDRVSNHPLEYEPNIAATSVVHHKQKTKRPCKWGTKELCKLSNERTTCYFAHQTLENYRKELLRTAKKACKWTNTNCNWLKDGCCKYKHEEEICVLGIVCNDPHCQKNHIIRPNPRNMKMPQMKNAIRWKKQSANQYDKSEPSQPQTLSLTQQKRFNPKTHREVGSHGVAKVDVDDDFAPPSTNIAAELAALQRFHIMAVSTLNKSTEWNDNDGKAEELIHKVFTDSFDPKLTYNMTIWKSDYAIKTFVDGGADINIIGQEVASKLLGIPHVIAATGQCINIYAVDRNVQHKISDRIIVSMNKKKWNEDNGRMILIRTEIIFYVTPFIDKNMILLGRSGCKRMNLKTFNTEELKEYHYYVKHNKEFSILPNGEDENCVFDALALRGTGPPGLYLYDKKNNTITAIQTVKDVAKYKENKISTIKSWAKATDTATNTTAEAIDVDINMMRTTIEPINGTKTIEDAHKQEQLSLNGAANAMNTVTSDNKESKDAKAHRNDLDAIDAMNTVTSNDNQVQNIFKKAFVKKKKIKRRILRSADESVNNNAQLSEAIDQIKVSDRFDVVTTHALGSKDKLEEDSINNAKNGDDENTQFHTENDIKWTKNAQISETIDETNGNVVIVSPTHDESPSLVSPYDETNEIEFETDRDTHNLANKSLTQHGHAALSASLLSHNPTRAIVRILKPVSNQQAECIESNDETNNAKVNDTEIESSVSNQQSDTQIEIESKAMNTIQMEEDSKSNDKASNCGMSSEATQQLNEMASIDLERLHCNNYVYNANVAAFKKPNDDMNLELDANSIDDTLTEWAFNTILIEFEQLYDDDHEDEPQLDAHNEDEPNVMHTMDMEEDEESSDESSSCLLDVELNAMHTMETKEDEDSSDESSSCELPPERECLLKQQTNEILRLQRINYVETSKRKHRHNKRKQLKELNKETVRHRLASISEIDTNQKDGEQTANIASEVADIAFDIDAVEEDKKKKRYAPILQDDEIDGREAKGLGSRVRSIQEHDQQQTKQQQKAIKNQQLKRLIQMDHDRHMKDKQDKLSPVPPNDIDSNTTAKTVIVRRRARLSNACPTEEPMLQRRARPSTRYPNPCVPLYIPNGDTNGIKHRKSRKFKMSQIFGGRFSRKGGDDDAVPKRVMYGLEDDKYELYPWLKPTRKLGCGAYATVCEVRDSRTKRKYAIKKNRDVFNNVADARRILREIKLMIWMNHENVMGLVGCIPPETWEMNTFNEVYLIMTRCDTTLKRVIRSRQSLSDAHIQFFVYQIARGLEYMHSGNIIHRDLKPENILVDVGNCRIRITDIGLARGVLDDGDGPQKLTEYVVTRWYRAPEVMCCKKMYDPRIDVWSLGCVMAELYARRPLWKGQNSHGQLKEIFGTLGTPTNTDWVTTPSEKRWIERQPPQKGSGLMLKGATPLATQFISHLLVMNPHQRPSISQVIEHPFLASRKKDKHYKTCAKFNISFEFEKKIKTLFGVRHMMYQELLSFHKKVCKQNRIDMAPNKELYPSFGFDKYEVLCTGYVNQVSDMFDYKMTVPCAVAKLICLFTHLCLQLEEDNPYYQVQNGSINTLSTNGHEHNLYNVKDLECNGRYDWRFKVTKQQQTKPQCVVSKNTIEVTHNDTPTKGTGYSPNMVMQKIKPSISIGDHVIYRGPPTVGKNGNDRIGYIVTDVISPKHPKDKNKKKHYMIKNVRTGAKFATNKGHLTRFARPRLLRALSSNNPMTRMMDLKHWRGNNLSELIEKESSK